MMQDEELIRLYVTRSERAIALTSDKYGGYCHTIAYQILKDLEDSEECVNDTYWKAWNVIPPTMPKCFKAFLGKITRNLALHRWEKNSTKKRGGNQIPFLLDELAECIPSQEDIPKKVEDAEICALCNQFLEMLSKEKRMVFFFVKKCMTKIHTVMLVPIEVAKEAPNIPILNTKINK